MKRIFIGGINMEVNSFNPLPANCETFTCWLEGEALTSMRGSALELGGVYACLDQQEDMEAVPGFYAQACTAGPLEGESFIHMTGKLLDSLRQAGHIDGVLLVLHGAMQSNIDDCEGWIIRSVREIVGERVPIVASLDLHAMMTEEMVRHLDGAAGFLTYPHIDHRETGFRAAEQLLYLVRKGVKPHKVYHYIPLIMSCENSNTVDSPMVPAMEQLKALLSRKGVLSGSLFLTQPWLDAEEVGCSICIFVEEESQQAQVSSIAKAILDYIWDRREQFYPSMCRIDEALAQCAQMPKPICLVDYGDVPNAGGTGDSTVILKALLEADLPYPSVVVMADAQSTRMAEEIGVGGSGQFSIGGFGTPGAFNERIPVEAKVLRLDDAPFVHQGPAQKGYVNRPGMRALVRSGNVYIILCQRVCFSHDQTMLTSMGLEPGEMGIISMRSTHTFLSTFADVIQSWMYVDTPGCSTRDLCALPYRRCKRPIYPLDKLMELTVNR